MAFAHLAALRRADAIHRIRYGRERPGDREMAELGTIRMPMSSAAKRVTLSVKLTGRTRFAIRLWCGVHLIKLAARIIGCGVEISLPTGGGASKA